MLVYQGKEQGLDPLACACRQPWTSLRHSGTSWWGSHLPLPAQRISRCAQLQACDVTAGMPAGRLMVDAMHVALPRAVCSTP